MWKCSCFGHHNWILNFNGRFPASVLPYMLDWVAPAFPVPDLRCSSYHLSFSCVGMVLLNFVSRMCVNMRQNEACEK